jgi:hypothetical protein
MTKKLIVLIAVAGLVFSGCTSKKADEEPQTVETADVAKIEGDGSAGLNTGAQATDPSLEAALGTDSATTTTTEPTDTPAPTIDDASLNQTPAVTDLGGGATTTETTTMTTQEGSAPPVVDTTTTTTVTDTGSPMDMGSSSGELTETPITDPDVVAATISESKQHKSSHKTHHDSGNVSASPVTTAHMAMGGGGGMKKIAMTTPYQSKDGAWINTVYVARPKEKLADISMKIFGTDKSADLKKIAENKFLKSRSVKAGDKIFYTSPNRPDDSSKTLIYYEDMGMVPETYVAKKGESLKKVSKNLLGYDNAWKEMWASNGLESKTSLKDGETLRYWKDTGSTMAAAEAPPTSTGGATLVDSTPAGTPPPSNALPPPPEGADANMPPPPPADANAAAAGAPPADANLPPPPPSDLTPPPPPPPDAVAAAPAPKKNLEEATAEEGGTGLDSDTMMSMGALGVLVALLAFVIIRKKKQKAAAAQMNNDINA